MSGVLTMLALGCATTGTAGDGSLRTVLLQVGGRTVTAEVADEPAERERGLMFREGLAPDTGMLFVYPEARERHFWMKDTPLPLSIAYLDAAGRVVHLADMTPQSTESVPSLQPAAYALEMSQGWFAAANVRVGDTVTGLPTMSQAR